VLALVEQKDIRATWKWVGPQPDHPSSICNDEEENAAANSAFNDTHKRQSAVQRNKGTSKRQPGGEALPSFSSFGLADPIVVTI
jgi:hypothetical protein